MLTATWLSILWFSAMGPKGQPASLPPLRAAVVTPACGPLAVTAVPATIGFSATNPDSPAVAGNATASITWQGTGQVHLPWNLSIQSDSVNFLNCPAIPVSAVLVACSRASIAGGGGSAVCSAAAPLSAALRVVASGDQSASNASYQVNLNFTLSDSWKYIAQLNPPCALSLTYTVNFQ
jgi:hypothetical protein